MNGEREQPPLDTLVSGKTLPAGRMELVSGKWLWQLNDGDDDDDDNNNDNNNNNNNNNTNNIVEIRQDSLLWADTKAKKKTSKSKFTKLYNQSRKRSTIIRTSKPDIIIHGKDMKTCLLKICVNCRRYKREEERRQANS